MHICSDDKGYLDLFALYTFDCRFITSAHSTDPLLFISQDFDPQELQAQSHKTLILSCMQDPYCHELCSNSVFVDGPTFCSSCFYHIIISWSLIACTYAIANCRSIFVVFFLPIQLLSTCVITYITSIHVHSIDVTNLIICPEDSILIRPEVDSIAAASGLWSI